MPTEGYLKATPLLNNLPETLSIRSIASGVHLNYDELERRVSVRVKDFASQEMERPTRIVIGHSDPIEVLINLFASWVAGHCAVLVNPTLSADERSRVTAKVSPRLWIDDNGFHRVLHAQTSVSHHPDAALIMMTSGTTGDPKGVTHSLETLEARLELNVAEIGARTLARTLCPLPLFFGHGLIGNCLTPLYAGQELYILDAPGLAQFSEFGAMIDRHDITFLSSVPSMWRMVLRLSKPPARSPKRVHVGSAPLTEELWINIEDWCGTKNVFNTYGMTETANWISGGTRPSKDPDGFVGRPWGGAFRVFRDGAFWSTGRGEVALQSPSLMLGLWRQDPRSHDGETPFLTGDIGELAQDQTLRLVGRSKNEINRAGIKVLAEEVDALLERHPQIMEACAFGIPDEVAGELVAAVVKLHDAAELKETDIIAWCQSQARRDAVPTRIAIVQDIAKNDRGKLDRQAIQKEMIDRWC